MPDHYKTFTAALSAIEIELRRQDRFRSPGVQRDPRHARRRSIRTRASSTRADTRGCASGRKGATTASASRSVAVDGDIIAHDRVRRIARAYKQGIRRGDVIAKIDGESAKGWTDRAGDEQAPRARRHAGARSRSGGAATHELIPIELTRDEVHILTVPAYFMIDATTGYIQLRDFGENTDRDVQARAAAS